MSAPERSNFGVRSWVVAICSAGLFVGAICLGDELQNRQLLETLPRDRRASLVEELDRFDRLDGAEQTAIRRLDKTLAEIDPIEQTRLRASLQNYHLWFQGLTEEQRTTLLGTTDLDERFRLARKYRLAETGDPKRNGPRLAKIRIGDFGITGPYEMAFLLQIWRELPPEKRTEVERKPLDKVPGELRAQAKALKIRLDPFPPDQEKIYDDKLEGDEEFKPLIEKIRRAEPVVRKGEVPKKTENPQKRFEHPFAEFLYFEENRPRSVDAIRLERFSEACPEWFHAMIDSLAADDARDYLTILYRLRFPFPGEMPEPVKPTKGAPDTAAKKAPAVKPKAEPTGSAF